MGVGKTAVGQKLAKALDMGFFDIDTEIQKTQGMTISKIFENFGEEYFRVCESLECRKIHALSGYVISTGGGIILNTNNAIVLKEQCIVIHLTATAQTIFNRLKNDNSRPLLVSDKLHQIEQLYKKRKALYEQIADFSIQTDNCSIDELVNKCVAYILAGKSSQDCTI